MEHTYKEWLGSANYRDITSISFTPIEEVKMNVKFRKGDKRFWRLLHCFPIFSYKVNSDLYESDHWVGVRTFEDAFKSLNNENGHHFKRNGKIYKKAIVKIKRPHSFDMWKYFDSNESAMKYVDDVKKRCCEVGNNLF